MPMRSNNNENFACGKTMGFFHAKKGGIMSG
nr:MAG TPA: hypothetical protein [Caudoviricetes sp.]